MFILKFTTQTFPCCSERANIFQINPHTTQVKNNDENIFYLSKIKVTLKIELEFCWLVTYSFGVSFFLKSWWTWSGLIFCPESSPFMKISISSFFCFSVNGNVSLTGNAHPFSSQKWFCFDFEETPSSNAIDEDKAAMLLNDVESDIFILSTYWFALSTRDTVSTLVCWPESKFASRHSYFSNESQQPISGQNRRLLIFLSKWVFLDFIDALFILSLLVAQ